MHPVLFHIGNYTVHSFGVLLMLAFAASVYWAYSTAARLNPDGEKKGVSPPAPNSRGVRPPAPNNGGVRPPAPNNGGVPSPVDVLDISVWLILAGVIGARILFVALDWADYKGHPATWLAIWEGGISFHGALIGGLLAIIAFTVSRKLSFLKLMDVIVPAVMLGYAIGRIGCFFNGCCYGAPTNLPWGVRFFEDGHWTPPSHPTQIYASLMGFAFFGVLAWIERRKAYDGQVLGWYLILAAVERFIMEIWRGGYTSTVVAFGLTDVQFLCLGLVVIGAITLFVLRRRKAPPVTPATPPLGAVTH